MRLSTKGRYAVMAMADLAAHDRRSPPGVAGGDRQAAGNLAVLSRTAVRQAAPRRAGQIRARPRRRLPAEPAGPDVRIADIILAVDEPITATRCRQGSPKGCTGTTGRCVTHDLWEELGRHIHVFLSSVSLADVVERRVLGRVHGAERPDEARSRRRPCRGGGVGRPHHSHDLSRPQCTSPLRPEARTAMTAALEAGGNPSSVHAAGPQGTRAHRGGARTGGGAGRCFGRQRDLHQRRHRGRVAGTDRRHRRRAGRARPASRGCSSRPSNMIACAPMRRPWPKRCRGSGSKRCR